MKRIGMIFAILLLIWMPAACGGSKTEGDAWEEHAHLAGDETEEELYQKAQQEDGLVVYTVSSRVTDAKESFEKEYPGMHVEVRDLRSPDLIRAVSQTVDSGAYDADIVVCNDNSGAFKKELVDSGKVISYLPDDIRAKIKEGSSPDMVTLVDEAAMLFYNGAKYDECPISNIWELTDKKYRHKIMLPSPMRSFSAYALCGGLYLSGDMLKESYDAYGGEKEPLPEGRTIAQQFLLALFENVVFSNSSDEVVEAIGSGETEYDFGFAVSSKMRLNSIGYCLKPAGSVAPVCGARISYAAMVVRGAKNVNTAKLFIRHLFGGTDGSGEGYRPFITAGTWPVRTDVSDANPPELAEVSLLTPDQDGLIKHGEEIDAFLSGLMQ